MELIFDRVHDQNWTNLKDTVVPIGYFCTKTWAFQVEPLFLSTHLYHSCIFSFVESSSN